jgi:cytochrome c oxidase cbb3-type subunit 4
MDMDVNSLRAITTVLSFLVFLAIVRWAWSKRRTDDFQDAARLPFDQD